MNFDMYLYIRNEKCYKPPNLVGKCEDKRPRWRFKDRMRAHLKEIGSDDVDLT
jgi:hypothetical protein